MAKYLSFSKHQLSINIPHYYFRDGTRCADGKLLAVSCNNGCVDGIAVPNYDWVIWKLNPEADAKQAVELSSILGTDTVFLLSVPKTRCSTACYML